MSDAHDSPGGRKLREIMQRAPAPTGADPVPEFICPACGYFCAETWKSVDQECFALTGLVGMIQVALVRQADLATVCVHPDGTGSYGGAEAAKHKGHIRETTLTTETAAELLATARPLADIVPAKVIEDSLLTALAYPIAYGFLSTVKAADWLDHFARAYDRLMQLPETSRLLPFADADDADLTRLQHYVCDLLDQGSEDLAYDLREALVQRHILGPDDILAIQQRYEGA